MSKMLDAQHARYADWNSCQTAEGEYRDFAKFDFERTQKEGMGKVEFEVAGKESKENKIQLARLSETQPGSLAAFLFRAPGLAFDKKQDKLLAWHGAHVQDGFLLRVPAGVDAGLVHLRTRASGHSALHHLIMLEKGAKAQVIIECVGKDSSPAIHLHTDVSEALVGPDAHLTLATIQSYPTTDWAFSNHDQRLEQFAGLTHAALALGAEVSRARTLNRLAGRNSRAESFQLFLGGDRQFMDMETCSRHQVPDTGGEMSCRGALDGHGIGVYRGRIVIDRAAPNTISHQSGSALLLSKDSAADIIPSLQVDNDQVEAGHGATVGGLDARERFYLRSRGLTDAQARRLMMEGYFQTTLARMPSAGMREYLGKLIAERLPAHAGEEKVHAQKMEMTANPGLEARPRARAGIKELARLGGSG